jgi:diguanylate cyclase (GGDEF)-like protein
MAKEYRLDPNIKKQLQGMQSLIKVVQELSLARDIKTIQRVVVSTARLLTSADGATFVLRDGNFCHYVDEEAIAPLWKGKRFPVEMCVSGWVMLNRKPALIKNIYEDPRIPADAYRPTFVKSLAMVPIRTISPIGAIGNYWSTCHQPSKTDIALLKALADTTAVALENVQIYNDLENRVLLRTSELKAANEEIQRLSLCDELTGLYNRRGFYLLAEQELKKAQRQNELPMVIFIDIDGLKMVNDQLGHKMGDSLLKEAARVIRSSMRKLDIIGRLGGDEFCILALDCYHESVRKRLQKMIDKFNKKSRPFKLSMSIGFATPLTHNEKLEALLSRADKEMYTEKRLRKQARKA